MLIKRIQNSKLLQLLSFVVVVAFIFAMVTIINALPMYKPTTVSISQNLQIAGTATTLAIDGDDLFYFADGDSGKGIYKLTGTTREFIIALDKIGGIAVNSTHIFYATVGENGYGTIVLLDKDSHDKIAETINIRYMKSIVANEDFLFFQGCVDNQNVCNSVSAIDLSLVSDELIIADDENDDSDVSAFRFFKQDLLNADDPIDFADDNFERITNDPNNPKILYMYKSTEITGMTLVYLASFNTVASTQDLYPLVVESVDLYDNATGNKVVSSTDNETSYQVDGTTYLTRIRNVSHISGQSKVTEYYISIFQSLVETKIYKRVAYEDNFVEIDEMQMFFEYGTPFSSDGVNVFYIGSSWEKTSTSATMDTQEKLHLQDVLLKFNIETEVLSIVYTTVDKERIIGYADGTVYIYDNLKIVALNVATDAREEVYKIKRFSSGTSIFIDFSSDFISFYTADFEYFERIELN